MQVRFSLTESEFIEWMRVVNPVSWLQYFLRIVTLILALPVFVATFFLDSVEMSLISLLLMAGVMFIFFTPRIVHTRMFRQNELLPRERIVTFTNELITSDTAAQHVELKWPAFKHYKETKSLFLLFQSKNLANPVPKRALSPEQLIEFRELLADKISAG